MEKDEKLSIIDRIDSDLMNEAFSHTFDFFKDFSEFEDEIYQLKAQYLNSSRSMMAGIIDDKSSSMDVNRVRYFFRKKVKEFHEKVLTRYFDVQHFHKELREVDNQDTLLLKIMKLRLESMGYTILGSKAGGNENQPSGIIRGRSAVLLPLVKVGADMHAMAQVLRKTSITEPEKSSLRQLVGLKHRNVIKVLDCEVNLYPFFLIIEHVYGRALGESIRSVGPRPVSQVIDWLYQLADALLYMNQKNIHHFNVRPSKLYVDDEFHIMISPVNLNISDKEKGGAGVDIVNFWEVCKYGSPELLKVYGPDNISTRDERFVCASDQYSLGLIAYYALTGEELFSGDTVVSILQSRREFEENPESKLAKLDKIPRFNTDGDDLAGVIRKLLKTDPEERYSTLHTLIRVLHRLSHSEFEEAKTVQKSYRRAMANNREMIKEFYEGLIGSSAKIKEIFGAVKDDKRRMNRQIAMLQMAIDIIINLDDDEYRQKMGQLFARTNSESNGNPHASLEIKDFRLFMRQLTDRISESDPCFKKDQSVQAAWEEVTKNFLDKLVSIRKVK